MAKSEANKKYGSIAYSNLGTQELKKLRGQLLEHPSDHKICRIVDELYNIGFSDGETYTMNGYMDSHEC